MCTRPLKGFKYGKTVNGKDNYIVTSYDVDHLEFFNGKMHKVMDYGRMFYRSEVVRDFVEIPCNQCMECRLEQSRQWANRCLLESMDHEKNCFITLTFDDKYLPKKENCVDPKTGEVQPMISLDKEVLQKFFKRLRKKLDERGIKIRYFACGEYGDVHKSHRPHYHAIIFGWYPDKEHDGIYDAYYIDKNGIKRKMSSDLGYNLYMCKTLDEVWRDKETKESYGQAVVADCTWETCAYVARYVCKKAKGADKELLDYMGVQNQFVTMSRRPGIGLNWFNTHSVCYANFLSTYIGTEFGSRKISHNRYFDKKLEEIDPKLLDDLKKIRKEFQKHKIRAELSNTSLPYLDYLDVKDHKLQERTKGLIRSL